MKDLPLGGIRFHLEPGSNVPHIASHGVTEDEVQDVLADPVEERPGENNSKVIIGRTEAGRVLRVVFVLDEDGKGLFVITAYELKGKPLLAFKRRRKKKK